MGVFDKLKFWKKDYDFDKEISRDIGMKDEDLFSEKRLGLNQSRGSMDFGADKGFGGETDNFGLEAEPNANAPMQFSQNPAPSSGFGRQRQMPMAQQPQMDQISGDRDIIMNKNMEIISSKLDALKANLDSINQRLHNLERIASGEREEQQKRKQWY